MAAEPAVMRMPRKVLADPALRRPPLLIVNRPLRSLPVKVAAVPPLLMRSELIRFVVNVASRVQHLAGSGEIVMPGTVFDSLDAADRKRLVEKERLEAHVKGVDGTLELVRTALAPPP